MKRIFTMMIVGVATIGAVGLTACEDKKQKPWDMDAMVSLRPDPSAAKGAANGEAEQTASKANPKHLTAKEIVEQATDIWFWNKQINKDNALGRGFAPAQRDLVNVRLLMWGTDIIRADGTYKSEFIEGEDVILTKEVIYATSMDTIAYIPNKVLRTAQPLIKAAHAAGDYETCYKLFDEAFTFTPITGAEWLELKRQGKN